MTKQLFHPDPFSHQPISTKCHGIGWEGAQSSGTGIGFFYLQFLNKNGGKNGGTVFAGTRYLGGGGGGGRYCFF